MSVNEDDFEGKTVLIIGRGRLLLVDIFFLETLKFKAEED